MSDLKNFLRDVGYFGVGAAAVILEAGGKAIKGLVRKGEKTLRENQDTVDEFKRKAKEAGAKIKVAVQDLNKKDEAPEAEEVSGPEAPEVDAPVVDISEAPAPEVDAPVVPDAIYRTDEPFPTVDEPDASAEEPAEEAEKPEETVNG